MKVGDFCLAKGRVCRVVQRRDGFSLRDCGYLLEVATGLTPEGRFVFRRLGSYVEHNGQWTQLSESEAADYLEAR